MTHAMETVTQIRHLKNRWTQEQNQEVTEALMNCSEMINLTFATSHILDGNCYVDLRGVSILQFIRGASVSNVDLSFCSQVGIAGAKHTKLNNCRLVNVNFKESVLAVDASNCDFSNSKFKEFHGSFAKCCFANSDFSRVLSVKLRFENCDFRGADMRRTHFFESVFVDCLWDGCRFGMSSFAESKFTRTMPSQDQLGDTIMDDVVVQLG